MPTKEARPDASLVGLKRLNQVYKALRESLEATLGSPPEFFGRIDNDESQILYIGGRVVAAWNFANE